MFNRIVEEKIIPYIKEGLNSTFFNLLETPKNSADIQNEVVYMLEDQKMKNSPRTSPWRLFISIRRNLKNTITIHYDLEISIPKAVNTTDILSALESPYLNTPSLSIPNGTYQLNINKILHIGQKSREVFLYGSLPA